MTTTAEDDVLTRLHARLVVAAAEADALDVAYTTLDSPVGRLLLAATPRGVVRIAFETEDADAVLTGLAEAVSPRVLRAPARLDPVARELDEYFAGRRTAFDLPVDLRLTRGFRREVVETLRDIPFGARASYAALAARTGRPRAVRSVATACATNPVPLVVPCHRVVRSDGRPGEYRGGAAAKLVLLDLEARLSPSPGRG